MPEVEGAEDGEQGLSFGSGTLGVNLKRWIGEIGVGIFVYLFFIRFSELMVGLWVSFNGEELEMRLCFIEYLGYLLVSIGPSRTCEKLCVNPTFFICYLFSLVHVIHSLSTLNYFFSYDKKRLGTIVQRLRNFLFQHAIARISGHIVDQRLFLEAASAIKA